MVRVRAILQRVRAKFARKRRPLAIRVDRAPDPKTLDEVGRDRLQTHVRTRSDLF